ncbi:hypothetical protein JIN84_17830 [Luteolibacter yonseiensis]|uniref:Uncharacterized protein n=1 Tax=Luteolibacter yonseiensis TaxID=1144680 RepID=A0A934R8M8_9BACT|nr:hypothetical protein [Luteolibacter yonseiensis]MBK1817485.1 hypothetical protein [Luteolibacter yonseiensis]
MIKLIQSNWREVIAVIVTIALLIIGLISLGNANIAASSAASTAVSVGVSLLGGICHFGVALALAWFALAVTFPEANRFILSIRFDNWWSHLNDDGKARISLITVAVLVLVAALCLASA